MFFYLSQYWGFFDIIFAKNCFKAQIFHSLIKEIYSTAFIYSFRQKFYCCLGQIRSTVGCKMVFGDWSQTVDLVKRSLLPYSSLKLLKYFIAQTFFYNLDCRSYRVSKSQKRAVCPFLGLFFGLWKPGRHFKKLLFTKT